MHTIIVVRISIWMNCNDSFSNSLIIFCSLSNWSSSSQRVPLFSYYMHACLYSKYTYTNLNFTWQKKHVMFVFSFASLISLPSFPLFISLKITYSKLNTRVFSRLPFKLWPSKGKFSVTNCSIIKLSITKTIKLS